MPEAESLKTEQHETEQPETELFKRADKNRTAADVIWSAAAILIRKFYIAFRLPS